MARENRDVRMLQTFAYLSTAMLLLAVLLRQVEEVILIVRHLLRALGW